MKVYLTMGLLLPLVLLGWALAQPPATQPAKPTTQPQSTEKVFDSMLKPVDSSPGQVLHAIPADKMRFDASTVSKSVAPNAPAVNLIRENTTLPPRTGRLSKTADGHDWQFVFDSDGKTLQDPPMIVMPNLNLESMEDAMANGSRDMRFIVSGVIYEYHGRNYLMVQIVKVPADVTQQF
jgi:hypothetical protein